ncbi:hypothetical protein Tco_1488908, partial [Tanacetum coccineum]
MDFLPRDQRHQVQVFDFGGLPDLMAEGLRGKMLMEHRDAQGQTEEMQTAGFGLYWAESARDPMMRLCHKLIACSIAGRSR